MTDQYTPHLNISSNGTPLSAPEFSLTVFQTILLGYLLVLSFIILFFLIKYLNHAKTIVTKNSFRLVDTVNLRLQNLETIIHGCRATPEGHALIPLQEGSSLHNLSSGYVMRIDRKFEHRAVAEEVLGRPLANNEHVHHIYGPGTADNRPNNLCVMDMDDHRVFHAQIKEERAKNGKYLSETIQRRLLKYHYDGILLDEALSKKFIQYSPILPRDKKNAVHLAYQETRSGCQT